jgi:hypothetical protein
MDADTGGIEGCVGGRQHSDSEYCGKGGAEDPAVGVSEHPKSLHQLWRAGAGESSRKRGDCRNVLFVYSACAATIIGRRTCTATNRRNSGFLRKIRAMAEEALQNMSERFDGMYAKVGRPSIPPEKLLRAQLIQMLYSVRSERLLMEEIDYSMLFRPVRVFSE